jgi:hypothetical protein
MPRAARLLLLAILAAACGRTPGTPDLRDTAEASAGSLAQDSALVATLEREARALAIAGPCSNPVQCATAPLGRRACGGPRDFLVYCRSATDSAALFAKLAELDRAEEAWNTKRGAISTCELRMAPPTDLVGQVCREATR